MESSTVSVFLLAAVLVFGANSAKIEKVQLRSMNGPCNRCTEERKAIMQKCARVVFGDEGTDGLKSCFQAVMLEEESCDKLESYKLCFFLETGLIDEVGNYNVKMAEQICDQKGKNDVTKNLLKEVAYNCTGFQFDDEMDSEFAKANCFDNELMIICNMGRKSDKEQRTAKKMG